MSDQYSSREETQSTLAESIQTAGVAGAGGAGFPSYVKWESIENVNNLLVNHQESEPIFYGDKWLSYKYADKIGDFVQMLQRSYFDSIAIGTKERYRGTWTNELEEATNATVFEPSELPVSADHLDNIVIMYTPNKYTYSEESVLLMVTIGLQIGDSLPTEHGWIVHNTETLYNIYRAVKKGKPVTRKLVHIDGEGLTHRLVDVPIGTPGSVLLDAAGLDGSITEEQVLTEGGPGWCYEINKQPDSFGVRKRSNGLLLLNETVANNHTGENGEIDVREAYDWDSNHETEPTRIRPNRVQIPLITNAAYEGFVYPSVPIVDVGEFVQTGEVIAKPDTNGISNAQHASIDGTVTEINQDYIALER